METEALLRTIAPHATAVDISAGGNKVFRLREESGLTSVAKIYTSPARERRERHALEALASVGGVPRIINRGIEDGQAWIQMTDGGTWDLATLGRNLDNVTGYDDPAGFGAGPYVRVNEGVNAYGKLPNYADREIKLSFFGELPWHTRAGVFWTYASGDHWAPYFTISGSGAYTYQTFDRRQTLDPAWFYSLEGHRLFVGPRGLQQHQRRAQFDLRLERAFDIGRRSWTVTLDILNIINSTSITDVNRSVNRGQNYYPGTPQYEGFFRVIEPGEFYRAVRGRVPPRTLRLGTVFYF